MRPSQLLQTIVRRLQDRPERGLVLHGVMQMVLTVAAMAVLMGLGSEIWDRAWSMACIGAVGFALSWLGSWALVQALRDVRTRAVEQQLDVATALEAVSLQAVVDQPDHLHSELQAAIDRLSRDHAKLHRVLQQERRQAGFSRDLVAALDIADSAEEVYETARRAAMLTLPDSDVHLIVANGGEVEWQVELGDRGCDCPRANACPALRKGRLMRFEPKTGLARCPNLTDSDTQAICAPVSIAGKAAAVTQVVWRGSMKDDRCETVNLLAHALGARLGVVRTLEEREQQASTDPLTGLANRRAMNSLLEVLEHQETPYAVVACDLDKFKLLNDTWGHDVGDQCLKLFARVLTELCRNTDLACRPGGEEFTLVLPNSNAENAERVAERVRARLANVSRAAGRPFTVSMGVAARPEDAEGPEELLSQADQAMYAAKQAGRDRVVRWGQAPLREVA
jgi:diguanylate cyclase (GGDEF)-like protein